MIQIKYSLFLDSMCYQYKTNILLIKFNNKFYRKS